MNRKKIITMTLILALFILCLIVTTGQAQGPGGGRPGAGPRGKIEHLARLLGLTEAQKNQIKTLHEQAEAAAQPFHEQLKPLHEQAKQLTHAATFDEAAMRALAAQIAPLETELHLIHARTENAIYNLLTSEQKAKLEELHKLKEERGPGRPGGRP